MNWYIKGKIVEKNFPFIVVENNGIGYRLRVSLNSFTSLSDSLKEVLIYTHLSLKNEEFEIFGFSSERERDIFLKLIEIPKIGPKTALSIFNTFSVEQFEAAISQHDSSMIAKAKNVSKKLAESIILEFSQKISFETKGVSKTVYDALKSLGFNEKDIIPVMKDVLKEKKDQDNVEEIIKEILKRLG